MFVELKSEVVIAVRSPFKVTVSMLRGSPGSCCDADVKGTIEDLRVQGSAVPADVLVGFEGRIEAVEGRSLVADGIVHGAWEGECRRCLGQARGELAISVHELFDIEPVEGETYPIEGDTIDLESLVRETIMLELPEAPVCSADCAGLCPVCGVNRNETPCSCSVEITDDRWAALDALKE